MSNEKIIFLHIPKTAGSSLRQLVEQVYQPENCLFLYYPTPYNDAALETIYKQLPTAKVLYGHVGFGIHEVLGIQGKYVTWLRQPVERVISFYKHNARDPALPYYTAIQEGMSLLEMLQKGVTEQTNNHMTRILANYWQPGFLEDRQVLEEAIRNIDQHFYLVGLMERFGESLARLGECLRWPQPLEIPYLNVHSEAEVFLVDKPTRVALEEHNRLDRLLYERMKRRLHASTSLWRRIIIPLMGHY